MLLIALLFAPLAARAGGNDKDKFPYLEATVEQLQAAMVAR